MSSIVPFNQGQEKSPFQINILHQKTIIKHNFDFDSKDSVKQPNDKGIIKKIMQNMGFQIFITIVTVGSLFLEDLRGIFIEIDYDTIIDIIHLSFLGIFLIEIGMSMTIQGYPFSFFFFLDIISTLSIILDVSFVTDLLYQSNTGSRTQLNQIIIQSKASRAAARAVRVMKIFRLTRVVKLYKTALRTQQISQQKKKQIMKMKLKQTKNHNQNILQSAMQMGFVSRLSSNQNNLLSPPVAPFNETSANDLNISLENSQKIQNSQKQNNKQNSQNIPDQQKPESKISKVLSQTTIKKIIIVILLIMLSSPILEDGNYFTQDRAWNYNVRYIYRLLKNPIVSLDFINYTIKNTIQQTQKNTESFALIGFLSPFIEIPSYNFSNIQKERVNDIGVFEQVINITQITLIRPGLILNQNDQSFTAIVTYRKFNQNDSWFSIGKIVFLCMALMYLLNSFNNKISQMIVQPIQQMMQTVKKSNNVQKIQDEQENNYETAIVHNSILKIRGLMGMFFGERGAAMIYTQIFDRNQQNNFFQQKSRKFGIYGILKIKSFFQISQILDQDVITLANDVASVVHSSVYRYGGSAVKNLTNGFMVSWHLPQYQEKKLKNINFSEGKQSYLNVFADFALCSIIKIMVKINKEPKFLKYRKEPRLSMTDSNFQLEMCCTLSVGYACQGLVGSYFKLDTMHSGGKMIQLEKLSKLAQSLDIKILLDTDLMSALTISMKKFCRIVDRVKFEEQQRVFSLYTVDLDLQNISPPRNKHQKYKNIEDRPDLHLKREINMQFLRDQVEINNYNALAFANSKKQLREVLKNAISEEVKQRYGLAFNLYISGDWIEAKSHLTEVMKLKKQDKLAQRIYAFIQQHNFNPPKDWNKYRQIS